MEYVITELKWLIRKQDHDRDYYLYDEDDEGKRDYYTFSRWCFDWAGSFPHIGMKLITDDGEDFTGTMWE
jgi:hypothetical protein